MMTIAASLPGQIIFYQSPPGTVCSNKNEINQLKLSMKKFNFAVALLALFASSCTKHDDPAKNPVAINFTSPNLFPEGVVYDPSNNFSWLVLLHWVT